MEWAAPSRKMKGLIYRTGRAFQLAGLIILPSAIWVGHIDHNEKGAIIIFLGSSLAFLAGYLLTRLASKL